jgi:hypothetical protein
LTRKEEAQFRSSLSYFKQTGIKAGTVADRSEPEPDRFTLKQIDPYLARVHVLDAGEVVVVLPAKFTVRQAGVMIIKSEIIPEWFDWKLDLDSLEYDKALLEEVLQCSPKFQPRILNQYIVGRAAPLGCCQPEGVIIATGHSPIPADIHDEGLVTMKLWLRDETEVDFSFDFEAHVDRGIMCKRKYLSRGNSPVIPTGHSESEEGEIDFSQELLARHSGLFERIDPDAPDQGYFEQQVYGTRETKIDRTTGSTDSAALGDNQRRP